MAWWYEDVPPRCFFILYCFVFSASYPSGWNVGEPFDHYFQVAADYQYLLFCTQIKGVSGPVMKSTVAAL